ncbi:hypothetical protein C8R44DRAFT_988104 [Mycena epipterygia]|nr:hypothetical protein C8R44DRAFT_988104 [Mycena epipterygia]
MNPTFGVPHPMEVIDVDDSDDESQGITGKSKPDNSNPVEPPFLNFDSEDEDENENEADQKPLIAPSTDIPGDFEAALQEGFDFDGVFAFSERHTIGAAPNPCLNIDGLGTVGIPLSERDARAIIAACVPVCVPSSDAKPSGIWEMAFEKLCRSLIQFDNPAWDTWIQNTAGVAASTALSAVSGVRPAFTLKKLLVHETGSITTHHKESISDDESDPKIGDFIAILPSVFEGAQLQLRHAGHTKSLNFAHQSKLSTSIVAAYSGVEHTLSGVTSGYRLSLVYDMVQPMTHAGYRPTLPEMQGATQKLHNILLSWKQDSSGSAPESLACLLQHKYPDTSNFGAKSLIGSDALLMSHLHPLARQLKFRIYLAHVELSVDTSASARDRGYGRRGWGRGYGWSSDDECDMSDIDEEEFEDDGDEHEEHMSITQVVDLGGMPVQVDGLELDPGDLLNGSLTDDDPDDESFERMERTSATRTKVYRRTVLLIWPKDSGLAVTTGDVYDYACDTLQNSFTVSPTKREKKLVDRLLDCCQTRRQDGKLKRVVQVLRESADRWNDAQVLLRALKACGVDKNTELMGVEGFVSAYQAFGWDPLKDFYTDAMKNDESNPRRHALLTRLTQMAQEEEDAEVASWCEAQAESALRSLSKIEVAQIPWLADIVLSRGGEFLRDVIFPQLQAQKLTRGFWLPFLIRLHQNMAAAASPDVVQGLIAQGVADTVRHLPPFPTKTVKQTYRTDVEKNSGAVLRVIKLCVETDNMASCVGIFNRMRDSARRGTFTLTFPPWLYYAELSTALSQYMLSSPAAAEMDAMFRPFFIDVIDSMISPTRTTPDGKQFTPCTLTEQHKVIVMAAARKAGGITVLKERLTAQTLKGHDSQTLQALVGSIVKEFPRQQMQHAAAQAYNDVISSLVCLSIDTFPTSSLVKTVSTHRYHGYGRYTTPSDKMIAMVKFCFEVGARSQCQRLLLRFLSPPAGSTLEQHISNALVPFLPVLRQYLITKALDFQTDPYKMFAAAVIRAFADKIMAQKPHEVVPVAQLQAVGCGCSECQLLKSFFLSEKATIDFPRVQSIRTHLERQLATRARSWGVVCTTIRSGSPHTLRVTKPANMTALGLWSGNSQTGKTLLHGLGDVAAQTRILGADYPWVYARIYGMANQAPAPMPLANASQTLNAQKRVATNMPPTMPAAKKARPS